MSLIGTEFCFEEATTIDEVAGDALALKHSIQVNAKCINITLNNWKTSSASSSNIVSTLPLEFQEGGG